MARRLDESRREVKPRRDDGVSHVIGRVILPPQKSAVASPRSEWAGCGANFLRSGAPGKETPK